MNLADVIIPYLKKRNFINKSINSVLYKTYQIFEIIIFYDYANFNDSGFINNIKKFFQYIT